jgi:spore maturation protein CgeB
MKRSLRYLWVYSAADEWTVAWHEMLLKRRKERGYDVEGFCNTPLSLNRMWLPFNELDRRWKIGDPVLMKIYEDLAEKIVDKDVLILYNGANLHPEFVKMITGVLKVYTCADDPESTEVLSKPLSPEFDIHLVNNIACLDMYRRWGFKNVHFWPLGSLSTVDMVQDLDEKSIGNISKRKIPAVFIGGHTVHRRHELDAISEAFPEAFFAGSGWPRGLVGWDELWRTYRQSQIGWNFHNSTGPINFRTYELPAYGVMQICDNKSYLGKIFTLGREAIGFDSVEECIELTRYYLSDPDEQREIAVRGWKRWKQDYHPDRVWEIMVDIIANYRRPGAEIFGKEDLEAVRLRLKGQMRRFSYRNRLASQLVRQMQRFIK